MKLSPRFALDNLFVVAAAFLAVSAMTFLGVAQPGSISWLPERGYGV